MTYLRPAYTLVFVLATMVTGTSCEHGEDHKNATLQDFSTPQDKVRGEYLVTLSAGTDVRVITNLYGQFGIQEMKHVGNSVFLVTLSDDPGQTRMDELRAQESRIEAIQPNLAYRSQPKLEPGAEY